MSTRRRGAAGPLLALVIVATTMLGGCGLPWMPPSRPSASRLPAGRVLVVARAFAEENRPIAESAAELLVAALRGSSDVVSSREFLSEASASGLGGRAPRLVARVEQGRWPDPGEAGELWERAGIATMVAVQIIAYDQVWLESGKATRVGVEAQAFHVPTKEVIWALRGAAEVDRERGRAFQYAMERAVQELAWAIQLRPQLPSIDAPWPWSSRRW